MCVLLTHKITNCFDTFPILVKHIIPTNRLREFELFINYPSPRLIICRNI